MRCVDFDRRTTIAAESGRQEVGHAGGQSTYNPGPGRPRLRGPELVSAGRPLIAAPDWCCRPNLHGRSDLLERRLTASGPGFDLRRKLGVAAARPAVRLVCRLRTAETAPAATHNDEHDQHDEGDTGQHDGILRAIAASGLSCRRQPLPYVCALHERRGVICRGRRRARDLARRRSAFGSEVGLLLLQRGRCRAGDAGAELHGGVFRVGWRWISSRLRHGCRGRFPCRPAARRRLCFSVPRRLAPARPRPRAAPQALPRGAAG